MRILFTTYGTRPHYFPMVPLAWACQVAGHDVRVAGAPAVVDPLKESGLLGVSVGEDADVSAFLSGGAFRPTPPKEGETDEEALDRFVSGIAPIAFLRCEAMVGELVDFARAWRPDLIVYDPVTFAGPVAAQVIGVPAVCSLYGMVRQFRVEMETLGGRTPRPEYTKQFEAYGVEPLIDPAAWIEPCPPSLRWSGGRPASSVSPETPRLDLRYVRYNGPGLIPAWLIEPPARPRVVVTWGTTSERKLGPELVEVARNTVKAIAALDVEVVVTVGASENASTFDDLPGNVRPVGWVPFHVLAETCASVVHTGGTGMALAAAACGVPQLGITKIPEGVFNTEQIAAVGAGLHIPQNAAGAASVRAAVEALIGDDAYRIGARDLREEIERQPSPTEVVRSLERSVQPR